MADECYSQSLDIGSSIVLITGGSSGISFDLAQCFIQAGTSEEREKEIQINIFASMHLSHLFIRHFRHMKTTTAIINVSSGLAFIPLASISIYSATKAAIHAFTMSLRY
ncbi:unnamed protein product [Rotaria sp. Silwood1]|nr:unnamed protein product [Rotaria sp. Silwood1]